MSKPRNSENITVVSIFGPTAVGKSRVAVMVAGAVVGEIVSADSMQIYHGLPILTDQPDLEMLGAVAHHLIGTVPLSQEYSTACFTRDAAAVISEVAGRGNLPVLVGGTGLYLRALLGGFSFAGGTGPEVRERWEKFVEQEGLERAMAELGRLDAEAVRNVNPLNPRRIARALAAAQTGRPVSAERDRLWSKRSGYRVLSFGLELPRAELYGMIDGRVDAMLASGALEEVRAVAGAEVSRTAAQAIGFKEICEYLSGAIDLEAAAAAIKQKSRRYAKRQLTWMRKMPDIVRIDLAGRSHAEAAEIIIERIRLTGEVKGLH